MFNRRTGGPVVKRIDNYGPPNAKSPFGAADEKLDAKTELKTEDAAIKKIDTQSIDKNASQPIDSSGNFLISLKKFYPQIQFIQLKNIFFIL